jgi:phage shock protein A
LEKLEQGNNQLREVNNQLREENRQLQEEIAAIKETVSALVARNINARADKRHNGIIKIPNQTIPEKAEASQPT